jgi:hypothetical protein
MRCGGDLRLCGLPSESAAYFETAIAFLSRNELPFEQGMSASEGPMWMMGTPGSLIFLALVAAMIAVSLMLLAWR